MHITCIIISYILYIPYILYLTYNYHIIHIYFKNEDKTKSKNSILTLMFSLIYVTDPQCIFDIYIYIIFYSFFIQAPNYFNPYGIMKHTFSEIIRELSFSNFPILGSLLFLPLSLNLQPLMLTFVLHLSLLNCLSAFFLTLQCPSSEESDPKLFFTYCLTYRRTTTCVFSHLA